VTHALANAPGSPRRLGVRRRLNSDEGGPEAALVVTGSVGRSYVRGGSSSSSRIMYSAYQSGHCSPCSPVSF
jgi:hypothetical protein